MTHGLQNMPIGKRIALALAMPIVGLLFFSLWTLGIYQRTANDARDLLAMAGLAPSVSALIHELQQERGVSAGFIGSRPAGNGNGNNAFADRLPARYQQTDEKKQALFTLIDSPDNLAIANFDQRLGRQIQAARETLEKLSDWRQATLKRELRADEITTNYGNTIEELIAIIREMLLASTSTGLSRTINAYANLIQAKELTGLERALGSTRFTEGRLDPASHTRLLNLIDRQKRYLEQFRQVASPQQVKHLEQALAGADSIEIERLRQLASQPQASVKADRKNNAPDNTVKANAVDATHWFDTMTRRIDQMKSVEDKVAADLIAQAQSSEKSARNTARLVTLITLLALTLTVAIAVALARDIIRPITRITASMNRLAARDEANETLGTVGAVEKEDHLRGDEIGDMARAMLVFKDNLLRIAQDEARSKNEAFLRLHHKALSAISQGVLITGVGKKISFANAAFLQTTGYSEAEILGKTPGFLYGPETDNNVRTELRAATSAGQTLSRKILGYRKNGEAFWCEVSVAPVLDSEGRPTHVVSVMHDITESHRVEQEMRIAAIAFESLHGMMVTDAAGTILRVNRAFTQMTGHSAEEAVGQSPSMLKSGRHDSEFYANMWRELASTGQWYGEVWDRRKNGEIYPKWQTISAVSGIDTQITHYVAAFSDISERKEAEERILSLAFYDTLTQLPNRRLLLDRLQQALLTGERSRNLGALLFIDLDQFKTLNDTLGHDVGDLLLVEVAKRLQSCLRACDTAARLGGDEFVVMLEDLSDEPLEAIAQAEIVGEKILTILNTSYRLGGHSHHSTPSIGVTLFNGQETGIDELLKQADLAMYQSKASGRNTLRFFDPKMQAVVTVRAALEKDLRESLAKNEFVLYYQAQVGAEGELTGAEALVRWQHPVRGLVPPNDFIPLAEETGLILPLGLWVLDTACVQMATWAKNPETAHLTMAVNVSARQFRHNEFVQQILDTLTRTGADPYKLKLELTESLLLEDINETIAKMNALKAVGVGFALDDFGTGYSSLAYLKRLPLDQLKIDRSFVSDVLTDANDAVIARTIVALAHSMGLTVIAEGVELEAQRSFLADHGCAAYQGYLYGQPGAVELLRGGVRQASAS